MKNYLLDSDTLIYFLNGKKQVIERLSQTPINYLHTSRINYTELLYGAYNSTKVTDNKAKILPFLERFKMLEFDQSAADIFAKLKANLKKKGSIIADLDLMIASIAIANDCILVSNNTKHFERIAPLKLESWA